MQNQSKGFTLLEILVVLVLTSLITAMLLQGLQQIFTIQTRFGTENFQAQQGAMYEEWFRASINGIMPDHEDGQHRFKGEPRRMTGQTSSSLEVAEGTLVPFVWRIDYDADAGVMALYFGERKDSQPVLAWPGGEGRFLYVDSAGSSHDSWPPLQGPSVQVPKMIWLETGVRGQGHKIVAVPRGPEKPWPSQKQLFTG